MDYTLAYREAVYRRRIQERLLGGIPRVLEMFH